jgi:hypothetical protein
MVDIFSVPSVHSYLSLSIPGITNLHIHRDVVKSRKVGIDGKSEKGTLGDMCVEQKQKKSNYEFSRQSSDNHDSNTLLNSAGTRICITS